MNNNNEEQQFAAENIVDIDGGITLCLMLAYKRVSGMHSHPLHFFRR